MSGSADNPPPPDPPSIRGLDVLHEVRRTGESIIYRARRGGSAYDVRISRSRARADSRQLHRFRRDAAIHASLEHPLIPTSYQVGVSEGRPYVVTEYVEGDTLTEWLDGGGLAESMAVVIVGAIAGALEQIHARGLLHGDLRPENVVLTERGEIKLVDVGLVPMRDEGTSREEGASTDLRYAAPEQAGLVDRPVDGRADLYALGVVIFESMVGRAPNQLVDESEILGGHYAVAPPALHDSADEVSRAFGAIVDRLLEGDPDERYQTARGLKADLDRLDQLNERLRSGRAIELGVLGRERERLESSAFVGRAAELEFFDEQWRRVQGEGDRGGGGSILVRGAAGSGKTRLLQQVCLETIDDTRRIMSGRCEESSPVPFAPLRRGLEGYIDRTEASRGGDEPGPRTLLREAAGPFRGVLGAVSPKLGELFEAEQGTLVARDAHEVFYNAYASLFCRLAELLGGLLLWVDDAQWIDAATLAVLERIVVRLEEAPLLVVGTARSEEKYAETLGRLRDRFAETDGGELRLEPFESEDIGRLVGLKLGEAEVDGRFVDMLTRQSRGNPFVLNQQLQTLQDGGFLSPEWDSWVVHEEALGAFEESDGLADWIERRLSDMPGAIRRVLVSGALIGDPFSLGLIRAVCRDQDEAVVDAAMRSGIESRFLERSPDGRGYVFVHDRIREVLLERVDGPELEGPLHRRAAEYLDSLGEWSTAQIFARARHYLRSDLEQRDAAVARATWEAGRRAAESYAFEEAYRFLAVLEEADAVHEVPVDASDFYELFGRVSFRTDRLEEAVESFGRGLSDEQDALRRAEIRSQMARARSRGLDEPNARRQAARAFDELGVQLPSHRWSANWLAMVWIAGRWLFTYLLVLTGLGRGRARNEQRRRNRALVNLYDVGFHVGYYSRDKLFILQSAVYGLLPAHYLGDSREYSVGFIIYSVTLALLGFEEAAADYGERALRSAEKVADRKTLAFTRQMYSAMRSVCGDLEASMQVERDLLRSDPEWLDTATYNLVCIDLATTYLLRGDARRGRRVTRAALDRMRGRHGGIWDVYKTLFWARLAAFSAMLGEYDRAEECRARAFETGADIDRDRALPWVATWGLVALEALERGAPGEMFDEAIERHDTFEIPAGRSIRHTYHARLAKTYGLLERCAAEPEVDESSMADLEAAIEELEALASEEVMESHLLTAKGGRDRLAGDWESARDNLERAQRLAASSENRWARFLAIREEARLLSDRRRENAARSRAEEARSIASEAGWEGREAALAAEFALGADMLGRFAEAGRRSAAPGSVELVTAASDPNRDTRWRAVLSGMRRRVDFDRGALLPVEEAGARDVVVLGGEPSVSPSRGLELWRALEGEALQGSKVPTLSKSRGSERVLGVPLKEEGELEGFAVLERREGMPFTDREVERALEAGANFKILCEDSISDR